MSDTTTQPEAFTAYRLAGMADTYSPDAEDSPGATFLASVQSSAIEAWTHAWDRESLDSLGVDETHQIADNAVPIYTHVMWQTFTDLGAYREDPADLGFDGPDMEEGAKLCLYMIAERLTLALFEAWTEATEADEDEETGR